MRVLISGATGLVGSALFDQLIRKRADVTRLVRSVGAAAGADIIWDPTTGRTEDLSRFEGFDAVVHLSGESIAGRWSEDRKKRIRESRVVGTKNWRQFWRGSNNLQK